MIRLSRFSAAPACLFLAIATNLSASSRHRELADLSIEELMNESVTSVSKREQKLGDVAAAITVLTNEDLHRSGALSVAEALRMVPGMDVASVNAREWAISTRGFNGVFANKLLVLVDGRAAYDPLSAGVYWDLQQSMLEDVDRIEAIRGPGATMWGANAVNGVVNVVSKSARDTQGGLLYGGGGDVARDFGGVRYGGPLGENSYYRVFGSEQTNASHVLANGQSAGDGWRGRHGGFRFDRYSTTDSHFTWQSAFSAVDSAPSYADGSNVNSLARWTKTWTERDSLEVQAYYDRAYLNDPARARPLLQTYDLAMQQTLGLGERHDVIWGLGHRFTDSYVRETNPGAVVRNGNYTRQVMSGFVQDEFRPIPERLALTAGLKVEHNAYTGVEFQPSARLAFKPAPHQTLWAAASRAVRTPDDVLANDVFSFTLGPPFTGPGGSLYLPTATGNANPRSESVLAYEAGYRSQPNSRLSLEVAAFYNRYNDLMAITPTSPSRFISGNPVGLAEIPYQNLLKARTYGAELSANFSVTTAWRLTATYSQLDSSFEGPADAVPTSDENGSPRHQASLRSSFDVSAKFTVDGALRYTSAIPGVKEFVTADLQLCYRVNDRLEAALVAKNLFDPRHPEQGVAPITTTTEVPRSFHGKITWRF